MHIGFTGTQHGMSDKQKYVVESLLTATQYGAFHHGGCIGADEQAHEIAVALGLDTIVHPGVDRQGRPAKRGRFPGATVLPEKYYLDRNKDIVDASGILLATTKGVTEIVRSGTWSTIRYAREQGKKVFIIYPDGHIQPIVNRNEESFT